MARWFPVLGRPSASVRPEDPTTPTLALRHAKRLIKIMFAVTLLIAGVVMLVLPGPGMLVIVLALAILSGEFVWARRLLERVKQGTRGALDLVTNNRRGDR